MATEAARAADGATTNNVVAEVPDTLKRLTLMLTKAFYGLEHYVVVDKFVKERIVNEEVEGRQRKAVYLFINYKSLLNVTKYKIDHMRQKLEVREKDDVHKSSYRCSGEHCGKHYDAMDIGKIYDPFTQEMRCWQCTSPVVPDEHAGPTEETRSSLAKFNEQMAGIFTILRNLDGIRFARHILEPPIPSIADAAAAEQTETRKVLQVGERAFSTAGRTRTDLYGSGITVSIGEDVSSATEAKPAVPWLQDHAHAVESTSTNMLLDEQNLAGGVPTLSTSANGTLPLAVDATAISTEEVQVSSKEADQQAPRMDDIASLLAMEDVVANPASQPPPVSAATAEPAEEAKATSDDEPHEADFITVGGERVHIDDVTEEMVQKMTASEKEAYIRMMSTEEDEFY